MNKVVKLSPIIKSCIWGGDYFKPYRPGEYESISESWELSVREIDKVKIFGSGGGDGNRTIYNFQIADFTKTGVYLTFDNIVCSN